MYPEQTRINAAISYFFLGPFFLLSKKNSPFWEKFVQQHSKKATIIIFFMIITLSGIWIFRDILKYWIIGFDLYQIIFSVALIFFFLLLIKWSYQAFEWIEAWKILSFSEIKWKNLEEKKFTEEEKIRIFMSFLPFVGDFLQKKYNINEIKTISKVSNFLLFLLFSSWYFGWNVNIFSSIIIIFWIIIAISTLVNLISSSKFLNLKFYSKVPSYHEFKAFLISILIMTKEYILVAFGKEKKNNLKQVFQDFYQKYSETKNINQKLPIYAKIVAIPVINLIFLPILFQKKYQEHKWNILQAIFLTILFVIIFWFKKWYLLYFLSFAIVDLFLEADKNTNINAPIVSIIKGILTKSKNTIEKINELNNFEETEKINFNEK